MKYDAEIHHRHSIRLKCHNYAGGGIYFVTICAHRNSGRIFDSPYARKMVLQVWDTLPQRFPEIITDISANAAPVGAPFMGAQSGNKGAQSGGGAPIKGARTIMPDHFHGIIELRGGGHSLGAIIGTFKSLVVREYITGVKAGELPRFSGKLWQRNFYERIVRGKLDRRQTEHYINFNPVKLSIDIDGMIAVGNPAIWGMPRIGLLVSGSDGSDVADCPVDVDSGFVFMSGCHSGSEENLAHRCGLPLIWMPAVRQESLGWKRWQIEMPDAGRLLVVCPFDAERTTRANALKRNRMIAEKSDKLWIPSVRTGGSLEKLKLEFADKAVEKRSAGV